MEQEQRMFIQQKLSGSSKQMPSGGMWYLEGTPLKIW